LPRPSPVALVVAFVLVGTLLVWGLIVLAGPGRPSDPVVFASVSVPIVVALAFGWLLARQAKE
jgi:hypothetical protein